MKIIEPLLMSVAFVFTVAIFGTAYVFDSIKDFKDNLCLKSK